ncbi:MAG TPA: ImmA/IrrE family metallo-endopeptidase [Rhizomicrobium sp.]|nr:ImmA/IrrE family metallo-endopeptidase [Rhizomicrobium sp.]
MTTAGETIEFVLRPSDDAGRSLTYWLKIAVDRQVIWPVRGEISISLDIQIDDLLAYLTEFWKPLMLRQVYPIPGSPLAPSDLRRFAEQRWTELQPASVEREDALVSAFEEAHDLSLAFGGQYGLPHFWMMRSGEHMIIETAGRSWQLPFNAVRQSLRSVGDQICEILKKVAAQRWEKAISAWSQRGDSDGANLLAWSTGIDKSIVSTLLASRELSAPRNFEDAVNDNDELRIAARMAGALPTEQIRTIIQIARKFKKHDAAGLDALADDCATYIASHFHRSVPFKQGEAAARLARQKLGLADHISVNVADIARSLGIEVRIEATTPSTLDGLAIWGDAYGPGVFLNQSSGRIKERFGSVEDDNSIRVTLAHELCHLLIDEGHALSAVDILNARMPAGTETRAKSFAGEFLLPTQTAARAWELANRPRDYAPVEKLIRELSDDFGVTWSVAAWKLEHGADAHNVDLGRVLDIVAPNR